MLARLVDLLAGNSLDLGYAFVFLILLLCGFGLPMPEDVVLVTGGVLAWLSSDLESASLAGMLRDQGLLAMIALRRVISPQKLELVEKKVRTRGNVVVMFARFLPGLRAPTFFTVGHARMPLWEFLLFDGVAALVSAPLWVCVGFWFGSDLEEAAHVAARFSHYILLGVAVVLAALALRWVQARRGTAAAPAPDAERD